MPQKQLAAIDRLPIICAAGTSPRHCESVGDVMREYSKHDLAEKIIKQKDRLSELSPGLPATPVIPDHNQVKDVLTPDLNKSRFLEFKDQFYENLYCKKVALGKPTPSNSKPDDITNENRTFGDESKKADPVYELVLPRKSPDDVLKECVKWHDKYRISHGHYFPSERIRSRGYNEHFNPNQTYGEKIDVDITGGRIKTILTDFNGSSNLHIISKSQETFLKQNKAKIGESLKRHDDAVDLSTVQGRPGQPDPFHVKELLNSTVTADEIREYANVTTYRAFATDFCNPPRDCRGPAGRMESQYPRKGNCKFLAENLGEETTAKQLISPSIPQHFGLSHRDFLVPRPKEQIRRIFTKAGFDLKDEEFFEKVWAMALMEWTSLGDRVSVEAFKYALKKNETEVK